MATQLPHNDPDLLLARKLGQRLSEQRPVASMEDPLIRELSAYQQRKQQSITGERADSEQLWGRINEDITKEHSSSAPIPLFSSTTMRWATAAAVLLAALVGFVYFQFLQGPALVAESGTAIQTVQLADGSQVTLRPHSALYQLSESDNRASYRLSGEAYFEITTNPSRIFEVEAGSGRVRVLGTKFMVSSWGDITQVFLEEGSVRFEGTAGTESVILSPGEAASVTENEAPVMTQNTPQEFTDWLRNELVFQNRSAGQIFDELEQHYNIEITAPQSVRETSLSGSIALEDQASALNYIALSLSGEFNQVGERAFNFIPNGE